MMGTMHYTLHKLNRITYVSYCFLHNLRYGHDVVMHDTWRHTMSFLRLSENLSPEEIPVYEWTNGTKNVSDTQNRLNKVGCSCVHAAIVISNI